MAVGQGLVGGLVEPAGDAVCLRVEQNAAPTVRPAGVADRNKERGGEPVSGRHLDPENRRVAAEAHRPDAKTVCDSGALLLQSGKRFVWVCIADNAQKLLFRDFQSGCPVASDTDTDIAGRAAFALRLPDSMKYRQLDALYIAPCFFAEFGHIHGQAVLRTDILAAATLQHQTDIDSVFSPCLVMEDGCAGTQVITRVLARDRVHGVLPEVADSGGLGDRRFRGLLEGERVIADRMMNIEFDHSGILTDRRGLLRRCVYITVDGIECEQRP